MTRNLFALLFLVGAGLGTAGKVTAQDWQPPSRTMPPMPQASEVNAGWMASNNAWFGAAAQAVGVDGSSLRISSEGRLRGGEAQVVRANSGPLPVVVWQDRNGDARADLIEIFRSGGVVIQLIDADYDGAANVLRIYDASGRLVREDRL